VALATMWVRRRAWVRRSRRSSQVRRVANS
jgi:hypothetical protein